MQSTDATPRFRNLSISGTTKFSSSSFFNEKDHEENRDPEKECFMCRQANIYMQPIGMQNERRIARRHPPPLTQAQIDELSRKKNLTKKEARKLLQCYFPEIKNVKYFQLHKYHSCCYDPKHLNLCKNHITALQREHEEHDPAVHSYQHEEDEDHYRAYERNGKNHNRVSFIRIKIEPNNGIPTRFLGPAALPESLAEMLIRQVNRYENKKKPLTFGSTKNESLGIHNISKYQQIQADNLTRVSEQLANIPSDDEDDDEYSDDGDYVQTKESHGIHGFNGKVMDRSRMLYEKRLHTRENTETSNRTSRIENSRKMTHNGDLIVEDVDELNELFVDQNGSPKPKALKKKKRKRKTKKSNHTHDNTKLNHWEALALEQAQREACGCRHHVRRLEANQVIYDWCRCKDHKHRELRKQVKVVPPPPPPKPVTPPPKIEKKSIAVSATEPMSTELALAYDPSSVDYDILQETIYYRTSSGRLVKPEITKTFAYNSMPAFPNSGSFQTAPKTTGVFVVTPSGRLAPIEGSTGSFRVRSPDESERLYDPAFSSFSNGGIRNHKRSNQHPRVEGTINGGDEDQDDDDDDTTADENDNNAHQEKVSPTMNSTNEETRTPVQSPSIPLSMQKSSKPTYLNQRPTPNFDRESTILKNRRWFDQPLGDQNLLTVQDGRYGLIAGASTEQYQFNSRLPDNDYIEQDAHANKSNCTIS